MTGIEWVPQYYFGPDGMVAERKADEAARLTGPGADEETRFLIRYDLCSYGDCLISHWVIRFLDGSNRSFFATFDTAAEAHEYLREWGNRRGMAYARMALEDLGAPADGAGGTESTGDAGTNAPA